MEEISGWDTIMVELTATDKLISILSSLGKISKQSHSSASIYSLIEALNLNIGTDTDISSWLSTLEDFGFIHIDYERNFIYSIKPYLCRSAVNSNELILCGVRNTELIEDLQTWCKNNHFGFQLMSNSNNFPSRISMYINDKIKNIALANFELVVPDTPTAYSLAYRKIYPRDVINASDDIYFESMEKFLVYLAEEKMKSLDPYFLTYRKNITFFDTESLHFKDVMDDSKLKLVKFHKDYRDIYELISGDQDSGYYYLPGINPRYAKYLLFSDKNYRLLFDKSKNCLFIPKYCPLPKYYSFALSHCSCMYPDEVVLDLRNPQIIGGACSNTFIRYLNIPEIIVKIICNQLSIGY